MNDPIFEPININSLKINNRIYMPAMHLGMSNAYEVTDQLIDFYAERAAGGAGMIVIGFAAVNDVAGGMPNLIGAHDDMFIPGLARLAKAVKEKGARCAIQINHAGANAFSLAMDGKQPVAPSDVPGISKETPRPLTLEEIKQTIEDFGAAARRVKQAGFDAVEVLSASGYLISEFLSAITNKRDDEYGGSLEQRMRFGLEVLQSVRRSVGADYPVIVRINGNEFMPGGLNRKDLQRYAERLVKEGGVDAINVNVGWHQARVPQITSAVPRGMYAYLARGIRECVDVPVIASHRINSPEVARALLDDHLCDMVAMGRSLIADPYLPLKAASNREDEIVHCIACAQGCFDALSRLTHVNCLCNPKAGYEKSRRIEKTASPKKVMVIGGGPAGMNAALAARERGHEVVLYEKEKRLGGQLHLAGRPPGREEFLEFARDLSTQVQIKSIKLNLGYIVDKDTIVKEQPDTIILATGAQPAKPRIPGLSSPNVVDAWDVLEGKVRTGRKVVVIGGGAVGVETALFLAEKGTLSADALKFLMVNEAESDDDLYYLAIKGSKEIVLIEMLPKIGQDFGIATRWGMLKGLTRHGVDVRTDTIALGIEESGVRIKEGEKEAILEADTVVIAVGSISDNSLEGAIADMGIDYKVIGDAKKVAQAYEAVHDGFNAGRDIL